MFVGGIREGCETQQAVSSGIIEAGALSQIVEGLGCVYIMQVDVPLLLLLS